jgi:P4 family phage/plasmid primase-like protien
MELMFELSEVVEIRAIGGVSGKNKAWEGACYGAKGTVAGYFNDPDSFEECGRGADDAKAHGVYFTLNPCKPALLARAANRLKANINTTTDADILAIRWLPIDLDPKRPSGISSSAEELQTALDLAKRIAQWLEGELGFAKGIRAFSGNGYHLLYRLPDLPNVPETTVLLKKCLAALAAHFRSNEVEIDQKVFNPARIWKLYGTHARKGDNTKERPHRLSKLMVEAKRLADLGVVDHVALDKLAALAPPGSYEGYAAHSPSLSPIVSLGKPAKQAKKMKFNLSNLGTVDVGAYLTHYGIPFRLKERGAVKSYILDTCLFDENHRGGEARIDSSPNPPFLTYNCYHNSCKAYRWKDAKQIISGDASMARFCAGYDPNWKPAEAGGSGILDSFDVVPVCDLELNPPEGIPLPEDIDPKEFYRKKGDRMAFVPYNMAKYYVRVLGGNLIHTEDQFYRYKDGVWRTVSRHALSHICVRALQGESQPQFIDGTIKILAGLVNREENEWPKYPDYINCLNGMINLRTGQLEEHDPKYGSRTQIPVKFDLDADYTNWWKFLNEIFPGEPDKIDLLQEYFGYCLLSDCRFQKALFLYGVGANGKSTVLNVLREVVGPENTSSIEISSLEDKFTAYYLQNKLVNVATETTSRAPIGTQIFKKAIGGETLTVERKYGSKYDFTPFAKFLIAMNDQPVITDKTPGFERRIIVLEFNRRFKEEEQDPDLFEKLEEEKDGILMFSLLGLERLLKRKRFLLSTEITKATRRFLNSLNPFLIWKEERTMEGPGDEGFYVEVKAAWEDYKNWCKDGEHRMLSKSRFLEQIAMHCPGVERKLYTYTRRMHLVGLKIALKD